jgi:alpha-glucosidase
MENYRDFTVDPVNFADLGDFVDELHDKHMRYVPIVDAGISQRDNGEYEAYKDGVEKDIFLKNDKGEILTARVWPVDAVFPDWFNDDTAPWWGYWLSKVYD